MRKHGWQLPYHPLQVVAVAVFLSLGFAFYVFFAPFIGRKLFQYIVIGLYTPLITCVFGLYIWCAAVDPADPGVFKSRKYLNIPDCGKSSKLKNSKFSGESKLSIHNPNALSTEEKAHDMSTDENPKASSEIERKGDTPTKKSSCLLLQFSWCSFLCNSFSSSKETPDEEMSEADTFYCSLCQVEVHKCSKHCRVCDKCVGHFDHHCRWLNNCIGRKNYRQFFTLMVTSLLLLILQWTCGVLVLIFCFLEKKRFSSEISSKLGSSFTFASFVIVVVVCTVLAMIATLPLAQLFFFHILLIKKGISTYDYIVVLRELEQEQVGGGTGQQSPPLSVASSFTGLSSASSFSNFNRAIRCTPPRLFLEDQLDVLPPETGYLSSSGKNMAMEETAKKKNHPNVKISPFILARMNAEEASKMAAKARNKSNIRQEVDGGFSNSGRRKGPRMENNRRRLNKHVRHPADITLEPISNVSFKAVDNALAPLQLEARSAFKASSAEVVVVSSPESSLDSPDIQPFRASSSRAEDARRVMDLRGDWGPTEKDIALMRSTSDGYEPSGGEDSDRVPTKVVQRSTEWSNVRRS